MGEWEETWPGRFNAAVGEWRIIADRHSVTLHRQGGSIGFKAVGIPEWRDGVEVEGLSEMLWFIPLIPPGALFDWLEEQTGSVEARKKLEARP
jgi:hypothetical protein